MNETTRQIRIQATLPQPEELRITAPGRLHLGFMDLSGSLGRRFGSLGITLDHPSTVIRMRRAARLTAQGPDAGRALLAAQKAAARFGLDMKAEITVESALPPHSGLGSGTQLGLAVAVGLCQLHGIAIPVREIGAALGRGTRSSIGIGAFTQGGVILDGGRKIHDRDACSQEPPPILARLPFPEKWQVLLVYDHAHKGLSGSEEAAAMDSLPPFPDALAGHLARLTLMNALPALAEEDAETFAAAIGDIQRRLAGHYAKAQGGRYTSAAVAEVMAWLERRGLRGLGQSSWGPTGFAIIGDPAQAEELVEAARRRYSDHPSLAFDCVRGRNSGARIEHTAGL